MGRAPRTGRIAQVVRFAETSAHGASANGGALYAASYVRDKLGRITGKTESIGGATDTYVFTYNLAGRLTGVSKNAATIESYAYDANGNRTSATVNGIPRNATYDDQDRMLSDDSATFTHSAAGDLASRTQGGQTTTYQYDHLGNLVSVTLPDTSVISYVVDAQRRRVGKRVNGTLVKGFLYGGDRKPVAELDGTGALQSRFVYAIGNAPAAMTRGGVSYRIVTDHTGSVRLVVDSTTGTIAQRLDYDGFGNVTLDTNPGFQPFGYAGGVYDQDTGLVRFGRRDYAASTGRWTAKDPLGFSGRDTNLYAYVRGDPINRTDSRGTIPDGCWIAYIDDPAGNVACPDEASFDNEDENAPPPPPEVCSLESRPARNAVTDGLFSNVDTGQSCAEGFAASRTDERFETECREGVSTTEVRTEPNMLFPEAWRALINLTGGTQPAPSGPVMGGPRG